MRIRSFAVLLAVLTLMAAPAQAKLHLPHRKPVAAKPSGTVAAQAIRAADGNRWSEAHDIAARSGDPILVKLIEWLDCARPGTDAGFNRIAAFVNANSDWPNLGALRKRAEDGLPALDAAQAAAWFDQSPPQNPDSMTPYYDALVQLGRQAEAEQKMRALWVNGTFTNSQLSDYAARYSQLLRPEDYVERTDRLIWDKAYFDARAMLPYLGHDDQAAANLRIVLGAHSGGADAALAEVPADRQRDPGVLFARAAYAMSEMREEDAATLLEKAPEDPPHPEAWSTLRLSLARRLLESRNYQQAYKVAGEDRATQASQIAESQFLAGWIALRFLNDPDTAARHFATMYTHVETPVSKARAAYWAAQTDVAPEGVTTQQWLQRAAEHPTAFYGQLAAEALGRSLVIPPEPQPSSAELAHFERTDLVRAARLLHQAGDASRVTMFVNRLAELAKAPTQEAAIVHLARDLGAVPVSVVIAKKALQNNICTLSSGYPLLAGVHVARPELALVHSIIRQESLFNPVIVSPSGAIGLMQLMPATAAGEAKKLGLHSSTPALSQNPALNVSLGSGYLQNMIDNFGGSYVLAIAAYNGGPGRVHGWLNDIGDPRTGTIDPIDWIELIPVQETRNYVQRVLENLQVYRARLAGGSAPVQLAEDLRR